MNPGCYPRFEAWSLLHHLHKSKNSSFKTAMTQLSLTDLSILLVEPSDMQLKFVHNHLTEIGIDSFKHVKTGEEALTEIQNFEPDLIISSMYLSDMSAKDLIHLIRLSPMMEHMPFMLISSETRFEQIEPIRQAGVVAILNKPFTKRDFSNALHNSLDHINAESLQFDDVDHLSILLVDDSATARRHMQRIFQNFGFEQITEAEDGAEAITILEKQEFDLIITDFNMPEMDGQQLAEHIRQKMGNSYTPIIMVTSEEDNGRLVAAHNAGISAICDKPFNPAGIKTIVHSLLCEEVA